MPKKSKSGAKKKKARRAAAAARGEEWADQAANQRRQLKRNLAALWLCIANRFILFFMLYMAMITLEAVAVS